MVPVRQEYTDFVRGQFSTASCMFGSPAVSSVKQFLSTALQLDLYHRKMPSLVRFESDFQNTVGIDRSINRQIFTNIAVLGTFDLA